jgi:hypothetical protein
VCKERSIIVPHHDAQQLEQLQEQHSAANMVHASL